MTLFYGKNGKTVYNMNHTCHSSTNIHSTHLNHMEHTKIINKKYILNFTPTGMIPMKEETPFVPVSPDEIVQQVLEAAELGVNMVHLHARDPETGEPTYRKEIYAEIIHGIRKENKDIILGVSTSGRNFFEFEKRAEVLGLSGELKPDFGSLTLSSVNFNKQASVNEPEMIVGLAKEMLKNRIKPELEAFDLGMINYAKYLIRKKLIKPPYYFNLILGNIACAQADLLTMGLMIKELPANTLWSAGGVGDFQLQVNTTALIAGGGVRVGLEDNIWFDTDRTLLATNSQLISRIADIAGVLGMRPYTHEETRRILELEK